MPGIVTQPSDSRTPDPTGIGQRLTPKRCHSDLIVPDIPLPSRCEGPQQKNRRQGGSRESTFP